MAVFGEGVRVEAAQIGEPPRLHGRVRQGQRAVELERVGAIHDVPRRVSAVQQQRVPVRVLEERHVADAGVDDLAVELDALGLELGARGRDVGDAQRQAGGARRERLADARRIEDVERDLAARELHVALALGLDLEAERLRVEALRARNVLRQERHEIDLLDLHQGVVPSEYGA